MAARFDIEAFILAVEAKVKADLNTRLAAITTEKGDSLSLPTVHASAYSLVSLNQELMNYDPFVWIPLAGIETGTPNPQIGPYTVQRVELSVLVVKIDSREDNDNWKRLLRYQRALREILEEGFAKIRNGYTVRVTSMRPETVRLQNSTVVHHLVGVSLDVQIV